MSGHFPAGRNAPTLREPISDMPNPLTGPDSQPVTFGGSSVTLERALHLPAEEREKFSGVVLCHPHPRYGGNMHNSVVTAMAGSLGAAGIAVLRFNFRGVGGSEGSFSQGVGEVDDAMAAVDYLALHDRVETTRVGVAGYSFGAWIALEASRLSGTIQAVASIACPMGAYTALGVNELLQPKLLVCGEFDHDFPVEHFRFLSRRFMEPKQVHVQYGTDHFFGGHEPEIGDLTAAFMARWLGDRTPGDVGGI